jgi:GTP cyclohydrolase II
LTGADPKRAAKAIDALRRGWPVALQGPESTIGLVAIETASSVDGARGILLSAARAATLKLGNQFAAADAAQPVLIAMPPDFNGARALAIADPTLDLLHPMKGPFSAQVLTDLAAAQAAMELAREAGLLPAFLVVDTASAQAIASIADVASFQDAGALRIAARAKLPVLASSDAELIVFRSTADAADHVALIIGQRDESVPVVRLHSECLTGDVLGSLKCDCGPQLHHGLQQISDAPWGILLYLRQEGRGIGLVNKLRAYALQDQGFDTVDANIRLGFAVDARDFGVAAQMLKLLSVDQVRLLTNNPTKVSGLEAAGIAVTQRLPLAVPANPHNAHYLETKRDRTGHKL